MLFFFSNTLFLNFNDLKENAGKLPDFEFFELKKFFTLRKQSEFPQTSCNLDFLPCFCSLQQSVFTSIYYKLHVSVYILFSEISNSLTNHVLISTQTDRLPVL